MSELTSPTLRRVRLARRLRRMREAKGLKLEEAARLLDKTRSGLHRIESGTSKADVHFVRSAMDIYDMYDPDLVELARDAARPGWWRKYGIEAHGFIAMETEAATEHELSLMHVPGLLQTEGYMRAVFENDLLAIRGEKRGDQVAARLHRRARLTDEEFPLKLVAVVDEAALRKAVGGADVMRDQLRHLARQAELPSVTLHVLPDSCGSHVGMDGSFVLLDFIEDEDPDLLFAPYITGSLHIENPEEVAAAKVVFDRLRSEALNPSESVAFVERVAGRL
ncbi:MAG: helix-turn-helix domain-containing protein [Actinophytocola sp.]|uniref:helix-turn-helix domain-containing protein n=1 Tax=Actinophytocola sp. TaxID=1872138 RepID=UPI003D6AD8E8